MSSVGSFARFLAAWTHTYTLTFSSPHILKMVGWDKTYENCSSESEPQIKPHRYSCENWAFMAESFPLDMCPNLPSTFHKKSPLEGTPCGPREVGRLVLPEVFAALQNCLLLRGNNAKSQLTGEGAYRSDTRNALGSHRRIRGRDHSNSNTVWQWSRLIFYTCREKKEQNCYKAPLSLLLYHDDA